MSCLVKCPFFYFSAFLRWPNQLAYTSHFRVQCIWCVSVICDYFQCYFPKMLIFIWWRMHNTIQFIFPHDHQVCNYLRCPLMQYSIVTIYAVHFHNHFHNHQLSTTLHVSTNLHILYTYVWSLAYCFYLQSVNLTPSNIFLFKKKSV